jgi:UDP-N-acetylmuramoyl-tripeptide--D-alanyl-D-alanine ligase
VSRAPLWTAASLTAATGAACGFDATGISIDSRSLHPGELFVALVGENGDGHAHVAAALESGAAGALVHQPVEGADPARLITVSDTLEGLRALARFARARFAGRLVAVTGSVGKTTTKEMLRTLLATQGEVHASAASHNNHWGVPLTLARLPTEAIACVVEIGMNHRGEIAPLAALARPHVGVVTAIERTHIGHLGSIEAIAEEKSEILRGVEPGGAAILPSGSPQLPILRAAARDLRVITFGAGGEAQLDIRHEDAEGTHFNVALPGWTGLVKLAAPGRHMAMNALAALAAVQALGFDPASCAPGLAGFTAVSGRGARRSLQRPGGPAVLLDESYNASAASVRAALAVLRLQSARRRIAVLGDMLELGDDGPSEHMGLADDVARSADRLFACGPLTRHLFFALPESLRGAHADSAAALAPIVAAAVSAGDAVLVKGSLGSKMRLVVAALEGAA